MLSPCCLHVVPTWSPHPHLGQGRQECCHHQQLAFTPFTTTLTKITASPTTWTKIRAETACLTCKSKLLMVTASETTLTKIRAETACLTCKSKLLMVTASPTTWTKIRAETACLTCKSKLLMVTASPTTLIY